MPKEKTSTDNLSAPYKLYSSLEELPLYIFRQCIEKSDLTGLVLEGTPPVEAVGERWANLFAEYIDLNAENETQYIIQVQKEHALLKHLVDSTDQSLIILENYSLTEQQIFQLSLILTDNGFHLDAELYEEDPRRAVQKIRNGLAAYKMKLIKITNELEAWQKSQEENGVQENYFLVMLVRLQKYGYRDYNTANKVLTVAEFVTAVKDYLAYIKEHNKSLEYGKEGSNR